MNARVRLLRAVHRCTGTSGLAFVPDVLRALKLGPDRGGAALLEAARDGAVELRPESGLGRLTPEERAWCPRGRRVGHFPAPVFSWVRLL